jgi:hypothetical protein
VINPSLLSQVDKHDSSSALASLVRNVVKAVVVVVDTEDALPTAPWTASTGPATDDANNDERLFASCELLKLAGQLCGTEVELVQSTLDDQVGERLQAHPVHTVF